MKTTEPESWYVHRIKLSYEEGSWDNDKKKKIRWWWV